MSYRQFIWGLSNGVTVFALSGVFWLGLGIATVAAKFGWLVFILSTALQVGVGAALLWAAIHLRRKSGFRVSELRQSDGGRTPEIKHILSGFYWTVAWQTALIGIAVWVCVRTDAKQMIWPAIALVVSLHLVPLARIFHVRAYYATAATGSVVSLAAFAWGTGSYVVASLAGAMAIVMWVSALYLLWNADTIAAHAVGERWATEPR